MRRMLAAAAVLVLGALAAPQARQMGGPAAVEALDGVDVVVLLKDGKEVFGKSAHRSTYDGFDYLFSTAETKALFDRSPADFAIQLNGMCARMGAPTRGNPSDYALHDGRIYIFGSASCHEAFVAAPEKYIPRPAPPMPSSSDAVARGRALLDKAAAAHGGGAIDAATSYAEQITTMLKRPTGEVAIVTKLRWRFPDGVRSDRTFPLNGGPVTTATILTAGGAWSLSADGRPAPMRPAARAAVEVSLRRRLLPILRDRHAPGVDVAALDPATVGGTQVERVRVRRDGLDVTLNLDAASGRAHSLAFTDRGDGGQFGEILVTFGDFRDVKGVSLPFSEQATFNGAPSAGLSRTLESADLNVPLDPSLFTPPAGK